MRVCVAECSIHCNAVFYELGHEAVQPRDGSRLPHAARLKGLGRVSYSGEPHAFTIREAERKQDACALALAALLVFFVLVEAQTRLTNELSWCRRILVGNGAYLIDSEDGYYVDT